MDKTKYATAEVRIAIRAEVPGADAEEPKLDKPNIEKPGGGSGRMGV